MKTIRTKHVIAALMATALLQEGCMTMAATPQLKFARHNLAVNCYGASGMRVIYAKKATESCDKLMREKRPDDDKRLPSAIIDFRAFEGPLQVEWTSRDGVPHSQVLSLDEIFKDRIVPHNEDPTRIDHSMPLIPGNPTIVVEVNDRTLSVYMDAHIALHPADPTARSRDVRRNRTLAYSKTF